MLILDTHVFFWVWNDSPQLLPSHHRILENSEGPFYLSAVSGMEIATKVRSGKWPEAAALLPNLIETAARIGLQPLPLSLRQAELAGSLPSDHKDPFDRLIAAQSIDLDLTILTVDPAFQQFGCKVA